MYFQHNSSAHGHIEFITISTQAIQHGRREDAAKFIVDVRLDRGGSEVPFLWFSRRLNALANDQPLQIYGIMRRYTFSGGFGAITELKRHNQATLVGQPAGTRPNFFGNVVSFPLPNSGMELTYTLTHSVNFPELGASQVFHPDIAIPFTSQEFFAGHDPYLEAALQDSTATTR